MPGEVSRALPASLKKKPREAGFSLLCRQDQREAPR
jgi:hypothetical protein